MTNYKDLEHLRWLRIGYIVHGILFFLIGLFPVAHLVVGVMMLMGAFEGGKDAPPQFMGIFFIAIALFIMVGAAVMGVLNLIVARALKTRTRYVFCIVISALNLMFSPVGIVIGIFSLIVLLRESVKQLFDAGAQPISGQMPDWR